MRTENKFLEERNQDLVRAVRKNRNTHDFISQKEEIIKAINSPSMKFWVTSECTAKAIHRIKRGDLLYEMKNVRREMFLELYNRYLEAVLMPEFLGKSVSYISTIIIDEPAPKFYIRVDTAIKIFRKQRIIEQCKKISTLLQ